jgi:hypothetical protein
MDKVYCRNWVNKDIDYGPDLNYLARCPHELRTMAPKPTLTNADLRVPETSLDLFWEVAALERDAKRNLRITRQIDRAIREHEKNISTARMITKKPWEL